MALQCFEDAEIKMSLTEWVSDKVIDWAVLDKTVQPFPNAIRFGNAEAMPELLFALLLKILFSEDGQLPSGHSEQNQL